MSDELQDSAPAVGNEGAPSPAVSQTPSGQPGSGDVAKLQSTLDAIATRLSEVDARTKALQGDKDRGVASTRKEVADLKRQIAEIERLKGTGLDADQALEELAFREDIREIKQRLSTIGQAPAQPAGNGGIGVAEAARLVAEYELDPKDADVAAALNAGGDVEKNIAKLAWSKARNPSPIPAQGPAMQGKPHAPENVEQEIRNYQKDMVAAQGNPSLARATKEKYRKMGVPVDNVGFH